MLNQLKTLVANTAKEELLPRFTNVERGVKTDGSVITEADLVVQQRIGNELAQAYPDIAFLGEEMEAGEHQQLLASGQPMWCLDPLDGTSNYAIGVPYFSVSLALVEGGKVTLGIVYDPVRDECFTAQLGQGAWLNNEKLQARDSGLGLDQTTALIDFKRLAPELSGRIVNQVPYASQRSFGSVALDWCWIAAGRGHIYLHGKQNIWDYAAGCLILAEAGGHSATLEGEQVFVRDLKPRSAIAALDERLFREWQSWLND